MNGLARGDHSVAGDVGGMIEAMFLQFDPARILATSPCRSTRPKIALLEQVLATRPGTGPSPR